MLRSWYLVLTSFVVIFLQDRIGQGIGDVPPVELHHKEPENQQRQDDEVDSDISTSSNT